MVGQEAGRSNRNDEWRMENGEWRMENGEDAFCIRHSAFFILM
jgi:hypothetical protein